VTDTIDPTKLANTMLFDTGVVIRALGHRPSDPRSPLCRELLRVALHHNKRILIAAPTIAELVRGAPEAGAEPDPLPNTRNVVVVAFDQLAAVRCGKELPITILREHADAAEDGTKLSHLKYDALVVGCALRWRADMLVSLDRRMAGRFGLLLSIREPEHLVSKAPLLPFPGHGSGSKALEMLASITSDEEPEGEPPA
jgi:predicted nucleic acid-binding protein